MIRQFNHDCESHFASAEIEATIMSGVGNRTLSGRELHDHIIDIDTDDSTQVYVDSSCKGDTVEEKHKLAESSCSNVDKKYIAAQVDEVPNLFGENLVQTDSR